MIHIPADPLKAAGRLLNRLKFSKGQLPVLSQVRLRALGDSVTLAVTTLDQWLETTLPLAESLGKDTTLLLPADAFKAALKADKETVVSLEPKGRHGSRTIRLAVATGGILVETCHPALPPEEFPDRPAIAGTETPDELPARSIEVMTEVSRCASRDQTRQILNGVLFTPADGGLVVATDGKRLAAAPAVVPSREFVLPSPAAHALGGKAFSGQSCRVTLWEDELDDGGRRVCFESGSHRLISRCIDGNYPNWKQVVPREMVASVTIPEDRRRALVAWLRGLAARDHPVLLTCRKRRALRLTQAIADGNQASLSVPVETTGRPAPVAVNPAYLADALSIASCLWIIDEMSPVVARRLDGAFGVVMPARIGGAESRTAA